MNISRDVIELAKLAADTVKNPTNIPTGDVISDLIKKLAEENDQISKDEVIKLLESQGFNSASNIADFIQAQIEMVSK